MAGVNSWVISYPADVVKTRIQAQHMDKPALYKNFFHGLECFKKERIQKIPQMLMKFRLNSLLPSHPMFESIIRAINQKVGGFVGMVSFQPV